MEEREHTALEVGRFIEALATRKQPARVLRAALARVAADAAPARVIGDALSAATVVALALGVRAAWLDDAHVALCPPLKKAETYEDDVIAALELVVAMQGDFEEDARVLRDLLVARSVETAPAQEVLLPLFAAVESSPLFVTGDVPVPERATRTGEVRAPAAFIIGPLDDPDIVEAILKRLSAADVDDVVDEVFAPLFDPVPASSEQARTAYALCALLGLWTGHLPRAIVPAALDAFVPPYRYEVTRASLAFARGVLERLEATESALRTDAPDADLRGRVRLRIRALRRAIARDRAVAT